MSAPPDTPSADHPALFEHEGLRSNDDAIPYRIRRSDRARRIRVCIERDGTVEVVVPRRTALHAAEDAVRELRPWIERGLAEVDRQRSAVRARGDAVPFLGEQLTLIRVPGRERVLRRGHTLLVPDGADSGAALERWYRRMARSEIGERLDRACAVAGLQYTGLTIRDQRTRWGSCSRHGALSFNWRLLLAPPEVLDYVIWHEVCHLQVMDHSPQFWRLVARYCPEHAERAAWLRHNAATLVL